MVTIISFKINKLKSNVIYIIIIIGYSKVSQLTFKKKYSWILPPGTLKFGKETKNSGRNKYEKRKGR